MSADIHSTSRKQRHLSSKCLLQMISSVITAGYQLNGAFPLLTMSEGWKRPEFVKQKKDIQFLYLFKFGRAGCYNCRIIQVYIVLKERGT